MSAARYFDLVREMRDAYNHRLRLVQSAREIGVKPTARLFLTTVPTVRKWLRRYQSRSACLSAQNFSSRRAAGHRFA
jgi:succinate dehydrogenase/fumarate reductase flavoprotein subunit